MFVFVCVYIYQWCVYICIYTYVYIICTHNVIIINYKKRLEDLRAKDLLGKVNPKSGTCTEASLKYGT